MPVDVRAYLESKGLHLKAADKRNVHCACMFCNESEGKRGRLYINVDEDAEIPGLFMCHLCGERGSLNKIKRHYGDPVGNDQDPGVVHYDLMRVAALHYHKALNTKPDIVQYLTIERGLTIETIKKFMLGWAAGDLIPVLKALGYADAEIREAGFIDKHGREFFNGVVTIPYLIAGSCVGIRQKELTGKYKQPFGWSQRLFNIDAVRDADEIVVTEGEFDCMIAEQLGYAAIGCPGATQWQESWNSYVRDAKRVWVVFDNDQAGRAGAERVRDVVGARAKIAIIPPGPGGDDEDHNDLSAWIVKQDHTYEDFAALLAKHRGSLLITVSEAFEEWREVQGRDGVKFGFEFLDQILAPGLLPGQVVTCLAKTNTGKTIWVLNMFHRMAMHDPNLNFLFLSLEQTRGEWAERAQRIFAFYNDYLWPSSEDADAIALFRSRLQQATIDWWAPRMMLTDKNRITPELLRGTLDDYEQATGHLPDVIAIDYLGYLARGFPGKDRYEKTSEAAMAIKEIAKDYRVPIITPHQVNRIGNFGQRLEIDMARDSGAVEESADFMFALWNPDHGKDPNEPRTGMVNMEVGKSRHGGKGEHVYYRFGFQSLVMVPQGNQLDEYRAIDELKFPNEPWELAFFRHRTGRRS